jgi:hypothetical protein
MQGRAVESRAAAPFIDKSFIASGLLQRGQLQVGVLVIGRDAGISVFHAGNVKQIYETVKRQDCSGFLRGVSKLTTYETGRFCENRDFQK